MRYISIFSGIEAASVAWEPLGWELVALCEVDEFAASVLAVRYPNIPNLGDITKVDWNEVIAKYGTVDVVIGGSPCQSFSIAGGRDSLDGKSRLMFEYIRAVSELHPRFFVFENVPGCLTTKDNAFGQLLDEMARIGYRDLAWRVLDAQFFGVPQRRRRVFLVGHLGDGFRSAAVLFEPESLRGGSPSSADKRKELTANAGRGSEGSGWGDCLTPWDVQSRRIHTTDATWPALYSGDGGGHGYVATEELPAMAVRTANTGANGCGVAEELAHTVDTTGPEAVAHPICFKWFAGKAARTMPAYDDGTTPTLTNSDSHMPAVCVEGGVERSRATDVTSSSPSAQQTGTSSSSTTSQSTAGDSSSSQRILCVASNHTNAEVCEGVSPTVLAHAAKDAPYVVVDTNE